MSVNNTENLNDNPKILEILQKVYQLADKDWEKIDHLDIDHLYLIHLNDYRRKLEGLKAETTNDNERIEIINNLLKALILKVLPKLQSFDSSENLDDKKVEKLQRILDGTKKFINHLNDILAKKEKIPVHKFKNLEDDLYGLYGQIGLSKIRKKEVLSDAALIEDLMSQVRDRNLIE